ncbi:MAG: hypothetical protein PHH83_03765 [Patescibacteria group bacterium]|nr:hypothetical protein [Patescibacteria group bacterium]
MKNKTLIILFAIIALAFITKFGLNLYIKINTNPGVKKQKITENIVKIDTNYNFSFENTDYEFMISKDQVVEKTSTGKMKGLEDKYIIKEKNKELMSLTFLPKETEKFLNQSYISYLEEGTTINNLNGATYKNNGKGIAYLLKDDKYNYLWENKDYVNFDEVVKTFKKK